MSNHSLPDGVKRWEVTGSPLFNRDGGPLFTAEPDGPLLMFSDLPAIEDKVRREERERVRDALKSRDAAMEAAEEFEEGDEGVHPDFVRHVAEALLRTDALAALDSLEDGEAAGHDFEVGFPVEAMAVAICRAVSGLSPEIREDVDDVARALRPYFDRTPPDSHTPEEAGG